MGERWRRLVEAPLGAHLAALAVVLLAALPFLDDGLFSADEGALLAELRQVELTGDWTAPNPDPDLDPEAEALPMEISFRSADGRWAPFSKNVVWVDLLRASEAVAGDAGPRLVSLASTWIAALAAALLARRLAPSHPQVATATAWLAGIGSPLFFDGYLIIAHTLGAALAGLAALAALRAVDGDRPPAARAAGAAVAAALALGAGLVRTEGVLFAVALGGAVVAATTRSWRRPDLRGLAFGTAIALAGPLGYRLGNRLDLARWGEHMGDIHAGVRQRAGGLNGRFEGFTVTWLNPAYEGVPAVTLVAIVGVALLWAAAVLVRRRGDPQLVAVLAVAGAVVASLRLFGPARPVPGLLVALPALLGLVGLRRSTLGSGPGRLLFAGWWLFALAVLATQYSDGGAGEWGGRYFALGLPLVLPLCVVGLRELVEATPPGTAHRERARLLRAAVAAVTLTMAIGGALALRAAQHSSSDLADDVARARADVGGGPDEPATILTTRGTVARFGWEALPAGGIHTVGLDTLDRYAERLAARGEPVVFYGFDLDAELPILERHFEVEFLGERRLYRLTPRTDR